LSNISDHQPALAAAPVPLPALLLGAAGLGFVASTVARVVSFGAPYELLIWPGAAVVFACAWRYGLKVALAGALGTALAVLVFHRHLGLAGLALIASLIGPVLGRTALKRLNDWKPADYRLEAVLRFLVVALLVIAPLDALMVSFGLSNIGYTPHAAYGFGPTWMVWWLLDALGLCLLTPALLSWFEADQFDPEAAQGNANAMVDAKSLLLSLSLVVMIVTLVTLGQQRFALALFFVTFPIMAWLAIRNNARATVLSLLSIGLLLLATEAYVLRYNSTSATLAAVSIIGRDLELSLMLLSAVMVALVLQAVATDRRQALGRVARQAREDMSTGLLNDRGLLAEFGDRLATSTRPHYGLIGVHLSNFDRVTDLCGAIAALHLEQATASLLMRQPGAQTAARLSSGRYTVVAQANTVAEVRGIARELYSQLNGQLFKTENGSLRLQASIAGLLIDRAAVISSEDSISSLADAMAIAASVRDPQLFVEPLSQTMIDARRAHQEKVEHIREAIREARLEIYAQPILDPEAPHGRYSYEVLTRLRDNQGKLIQPPEFMPLATQAQMTNALDRAVIQRVFSWLADHPHALASTFKCSINLSGLTMSDSTISNFVRQQQATYSIPVDKIVFEITESEAIRNPSAASRLVDELKEDGYGIALDDFGTGLATFEYLKRFPLDYLKIDGQFIRNLANNPIDEEIVLATIRVAKRLGVKTIAEHVHNAEVMARLKELGVDHMQGYFVGVPVPIAQLFVRDESGIYATV
jgi:EAL domain-containing protein (putative c-di-GMP-specific phosphodiesterase class I)/integral membrane sensor domain MASE1